MAPKEFVIWKNLFMDNSSSIALPPPAMLEK